MSTDTTSGTTAAEELDPHAAEAHGTDGHAEGDAHDYGHDGHPDSYYVKVALILAVITALETSTYWVDFGPFFMPSLMIMMAIKFFMVVMIFMHLKFDNKLFSYLFYSGLFLAIGVYVAALACFRFFTGT